MGSWTVGMYFSWLFCVNHDHWLAFCGDVVVVGECVESDGGEQDCFFDYVFDFWWLCY